MFLFRNGPRSQPVVLDKLKQTSRYLKIYTGIINRFLSLILVHPNINLFNYQDRTPPKKRFINVVSFIGIPFVFDQVYQVMKMVSLGVARYLDIVRLTTSKLRDTILELADDKG